MVVLGVDGGGTKTLAVMADRAGRVVAAAAGLDTNPLDQPRWVDHLSEVVVSVAAGQPTPVAAAFGLPAHGEVAQISARQRVVARGLTAAPVTVRNDVHTAHEAAFAGGAGVLLLAGTGSMCWAANGAGRTVRVGGWGDGFGDEGSAHWIGHQALAWTSRVLDGRAEFPGFADAVLQATGLARETAQDGLLTWFYQHPNRRPAVAALAATVDGLATQDALAARLMAEAAEALTLHVRTARRRLDLPPDGDWCFVGGVSRSVTMQALLAAQLGPPRPPLLPPVGGAVWRAAEDAGWAPDAAWIARLSADISSRPEFWP